MMPMDMRHLRPDSRGRKGSGPGQEAQAGLTLPSTAIKDLVPYLRTFLVMCSGRVRVISLHRSPRPERIFIIIWSWTSKTPIPAPRHTSISRRRSPADIAAVQVKNQGQKRRPAPPVRAKGGGGAGQPSCDSPLHVPSAGEEAP